MSAEGIGLNVRDAIALRTLCMGDGLWGTGEGKCGGKV